jgi:hypothetical protein
MNNESFNVLFIIAIFSGLGGAMQIKPGNKAGNKPGNIARE